MDKKIRDLYKKIPNTTDKSGLVSTTGFNTKIEVVENKIPDHAKNFTTQEFNNLAANNFPVRLKQANLV